MKSFKRGHEASLAATVGAFAAVYVLLAYTQAPSAHLEEEPMRRRARQLAASLSALVFSIALAIWGARSLKTASTGQAAAAVGVGAAVLVTGYVASTLKGAAADGPLQRIAAATPPTYPALVGLVVAGVVRLLSNE